MNDQWEVVYSKIWPMRDECWDKWPMRGGYLAGGPWFIQAGKLGEWGRNLSLEVLGHQHRRQHGLVHLGVVIGIHTDLLTAEVEGKFTWGEKESEQVYSSIIFTHNFQPVLAHGASWDQETSTAGSRWRVGGLSSGSPAMLVFTACLLHMCVARTNLQPPV